jgi:hypothetical protein
LFVITLRGSVHCLRNRAKGLFFICTGMLNVKVMGSLRAN